MPEKIINRRDAETQRKTIYLFDAPQARQTKENSASPRLCGEKMLLKKSGRPVRRFDAIAQVGADQALAHFE